MEQRLLKQKECGLDCICIQMGEINSGAFGVRQKRGLRPSGAATCDPREDSRDEERGLGANPRIGL